MIALIVILCIALVIALLLSTKIILRIKYEDKLTVYLKILFIKIKLFPREKKKKKRYPHSMSRKKAKKIRESLEKPEKKVSKKKKSDKKKEKEEKEEKEPQDILSIISIILTFTKYFLRKFLKSVRIKASKLHIIVASENAAKTAIMYGAVTQSTNVLFPLLEGIKNVKKLPTKNNFSIDTDFLVEKPTIVADITLYVRVGSALKCLFGAGVKSFKKALADQMQKIENKNKK